MKPDIHFLHFASTFTFIYKKLFCDSDNHQQHDLRYTSNDQLLILSLQIARNQFGIPTYCRRIIHVCMLTSESRKQM